MTRVLLAVLVAGCAARPVAVPPHAAATGPLSLAADDRMIVVPGGRFIAGSTPEERAAAYDDFRRTADADTERTERWFEGEADRHTVTLPAFRIDLMPVTQAQFAEFVAAERIAPPSLGEAVSGGVGTPTALPAGRGSSPVGSIGEAVSGGVGTPTALPAGRGSSPVGSLDEAGWQAQGLSQDFAGHAPRFVWSDGRPPGGREDHPVVLVSWTDADRYCAWRGALRGQRRRLPTADELEKAMRGDAGMAYPWGNTYEPDKLNSAVRGPGDTTPVGTYLAGASAYGVLDLAGNVYHWTSTPSSDGQMVIKGSAWRDFAGIGRGAWFDRRPRAAREVVLGFRCAGDA